jgi:outer membrane protein OmpA-like peptidoglycan-associated protein
MNLINHGAEAPKQFQIGIGIRGISALAAVIVISGCIKSAENSESTALLQYSIQSVSYQQSYGDSVRVEESEDEFVICSPCPAPTQLERLPKHTPISIRLTAPLSSPSPPASPPLDVRGNSSNRKPSPDATIPNIASPVQEKSSKDIRDIEDKNEKTTSSLEPVETSACRNLSVYFDLGSSFVKPEEQIRIEELVKQITTKDGLLVKGYTCDIGDKKFNDRLALDRAKAVADVLEGAGVHPLIVFGEGKCCYVSDDKVLNRRVEILCATNSR